jgi:hypothetical protein
MAIGGDSETEELESFVEFAEVSDFTVPADFMLHLNVGKQESPFASRCVAIRVPPEIRRQKDAPTPE